MKKETNVIDTLDFEISSQELGGKSATGFQTAIRMTSKVVVVGFSLNLMNVLHQMYAVAKTILLS
ncbi:MAG: hypothetical protein WAX68_05245 [Streptococcus suis]